MLRVLLFCLVAHTVWGQHPIEKAKQLQAAGKIPEARSLLLTVKEGTPDYAAARYMLGRLAFDQKKLDDAEDYFEEAVEANEQVADYHRWLAETYSRIGVDANIFRQSILAPKVKEEWERVIVLDPGAVDAYTALIIWHLVVPSMLGASVDKAKALANTLKKYDVGEAWFRLGYIYAHEKDYGKALEMYDLALARKPDYFPLYYHIGRASASSGLRLKDGEACLKKYLTQTPPLDEPSLALARMRLGQIYEKQGKKTEAKQNYEAALKEDQSLKGAKEGLERVR